MAEPFRLIMLEYTDKSEDEELAARILEIRDGSWLIAKIEETLPSRRDRSAWHQDPPWPDGGGR